MRDFWESRYAEPQFAYGTEPNVFLVEQAHRLPPKSRVLVVGDGEGRNGVWLAEQGMDVTSVDYSQQGIQKTQQLATRRGVKVTTLCQDLIQWRWPLAAFDAVVSIYLHFGPAVRVDMHRAMFGALKPGGLILLEAFNPLQMNHPSGGPRDPLMLYAAKDLRLDFSAAKILLLEERVTELKEGLYHVGSGAVVRLVAQK
jgi:cyclopropane fatty-acyl-phospholipid synthase-like methyltransferase